MDDWKKGLDRYLTSSPPDDPYNDWWEATVDWMGNDFYTENYDVIDSPFGDKVLQELYEIGYEPEIAAKEFEARFEK